MFRKLLVTLLVAGSAAAAIIPADRLPLGGNWVSYVGVPGGIPRRTTIYTNLTSSASAATINAAITACPSNQVVMLGPGTYNITARIDLRKDGVTLRGSGGGYGHFNPASDTILSFGSGTGMLIGPAQYRNAEIFTTADVVKDSTNATLTSTAGLSVGQVVRLAEDIDTNLVWLAHVNSPILKYQRQLVRIDAINGATITFWPPAFLTYSNSLNASVATFPSFQKWSGVEDFSMTNTANGSGPGIECWGGYACWATNVAVEGVNGYSFTFNESLFCTIQHCYCRYGPSGNNHAGYQTGSGDSNDCHGDTGILVQDNIAIQEYPGVEVQSCSGSVYSYNLLWDVLVPGQGNGLGLDLDHEPHPFMNLAEGNVSCNIGMDGYHGSGSHSTFLRNVSTGWTPTYTNQNSICYSVDRWQLYVNAVGNVLGTPEINAVFDDVWGTNFTYSTPVISRRGYPNMGNNGFSGTRPPNDVTTEDQSLDLNVTNTMVWHGNYSRKADAIAWDASISDVTIPPSYYLSSKPSFFRSLTWPPYNPTNTSAAAISMTNIPAGYRYVYGVDPPEAGAAEPPSAVIGGAAKLGAGKW
jgi:hypothetical protein